MTTLDSRLQSALLALGQQPDVTPDQVAQLRAAITADQSRLEQLNNEARGGHLAAFAIEPPGTTLHRAGFYEATTGVLTLPASSFQAGSAAPSDDLKVTLALQTMVMSFAHDTYRDAHGAQAAVTPKMAGHLQEVINGSPALVDEVKRSIREGYLERFAVLDPRKGAGGTYGDADKSMNVTAESLTSPAPPDTYERAKAPDLTFVIGHEIQHGFNHAKRQEAWDRFQDDIERIAKSRQPEHDYSPLVKALLRDVRWDEGRAEVAGWNALASRVKEANPNGSLADIYSKSKFRAGDFVAYEKGTNVASPKPGFTFNPDLSLTATPENIEAISQTYFNKKAAAHQMPGAPSVPTTGLGYHADADYTNYYGRGAIQRILAAEERFVPPSRRADVTVALDMEGLGLDRRLIESQGLSLTTGSQYPYVDTSEPQVKPTYFHHTQGGPNDHQYVPPPVTAPEAAAPSREAPAPLPETASAPLPTAAIASPALTPDELRGVQAQLNMIGLTDHRGQPLAESGVYDAPTRMAVMGFQLDHGLPATGLPDKGTLSLVQAHARLAELQSPHVERAEPAQAASREAAALSPMPQRPSPAIDRSTPPDKGYTPTDPRHPGSPTHGLYQQLQDRLPDASEARLLQCTAACQERGITGQNLKDIHVDEAKGVMAFGSGGLIARVASVDLHAPTPAPEQTLQHMQQHDQYRAQMDQQIQTQLAQRNAQAQQGPMLG